jgi:hypothetical protein
MRDSAGWLVQISCLYSLAAPSHVLHFRRSYKLDWNRTRNVLTQISSHNQPRKHDLAFTLITTTLIILKRHAPPWAIIGPCYLSLGYCFLVAISWLLCLGYCFLVATSWLLFLGYCFSVTVSRLL